MCVVCDGRFLFTQRKVFARTSVGWRMDLLLLGTFNQPIIHTGPSLRNGTYWYLFSFSHLASILEKSAHTLFIAARDGIDYEILFKLKMILLKAYSIYHFRRGYPFFLFEKLFLLFS